MWMSVVAGRREEGKKEEEKEGQKIVGLREDKRGDITYRYRRNQAGWLRNHGYLEVVPNL